MSSLRLPALTRLLLSSICLILLTSLPVTLSQSTITSYDCVDPNDRERTHQVRRGDLTTICLYVGPDGDWNSDINYKRFSVNLVADEFSSYDVPECECINNILYQLYDMCSDILSVTSVWHAR